MAGDTFRIEIVDDRRGGPAPGAPAPGEHAPAGAQRNPHQEAARQALEHAGQAARKASSGADILDALPVGKGGGNMTAMISRGGQAAASALGAGAGAGAAASSGLAAMAAAAGPAAPIVAAVAVAKMAADKAKEMVMEAYRTIAHFAQGMARLDSSAFGDGFQTLVKNIPIVGGMFGELVGQLRQFMNGLDATAKRLAPYSGQLSTAQARAEVRETMGSFHLASKLGGELSAFVDARSRIDEAGKDILATMLKPVIPVVTALLEKIAAVMEGTAHWLDEHYDTLIGIVNQQIAIMEVAINAIPGIKVDLGRIAKNTEKPEDPLEGGNILDQMMAGRGSMALAFEANGRRADELRALQAARPGGF